MLNRGGFSKLLMQSEVVFREHLEFAKTAFALGFFLLLIGVLGSVGLGLPYWAFILLTAVSLMIMVDGLRVYVNSRRGLKKCVKK
jgi:uncharacterized membrane protein YbaN (DUF454 family)